VSAERDAILSAQYVALTTYRRDGTPVTTPVWAAAEGTSLYLFSNAKAGKVKRLRNSSRAAIAPCTATGKVTGAQLPAEAFNLASDQMPKVSAPYKEVRHGCTPLCGLRPCPCTPAHAAQRWH